MNDEGSGVVEDDPINHIQGNSIDDAAVIDPVRKAEIDKQFIDDSLNSAGGEVEADVLNNEDEKCSQQRTEQDIDFQEEIDIREVLEEKN